MLKVPASSSLRFAVDLADRVFQRGDRFVQVGRLRVEELLALAGGGELFQRRQVHGAQGRDVAVQAVDLALQARQLDVALLDGQAHRRQVGLGIGQQLAVLLESQPRGLLLELEIGDALAQRIEIAFELQAPLVAGAQLGRQVVVFAALGAQRLFALQFQRQCALQSGLGRRIRKPGQFFARPLFLHGDRCSLLGRGLDGALQLAAARLDRTLRKLRFLGFPLQAALLLAALRQPALGLDHLVAELGMALLAVGQLHVQFLEPRLGGDAAFLQRFQQGVHFRQVARDLVAAGAGLLRQLGQPQRLHLQRVRAGLGFGRFAPRGHEALRRIAVGGVGSNQGGARLLGHQRLRPQLLLEILDFLLPRQQARLLRVLRVKAHAVRGDRMPARDEDRFAVAQLLAGGQRFLEAGGRVTAVQPIRQQRLLAGIVQPQQVGQPRQRRRRLGQRRRRRAVERQLGRRGIPGEGPHHVQARDLQRIHALAQRRFERAFPALLDVDAAPQGLQAVEAVPGQPRLELAVGLDLLLQGLERFHPRRQIRLLVALAVGRLLPCAAVLVELRHLLLQFVQPALGGFRHFLRGGELGLKLAEARFVGSLQRLVVGGQAFAPLAELARLLLDVALVGRQHLDLLLDLGHMAALLGGGRLGLPQRIFEVGQLLGLLLDLRRQQHRLLFGIDAPRRQRFGLRQGFVLARGPLRRLLLQLDQPLLDALAAFHHEADLGLQPAHFRAGFVEAALRLVDLVARGIVRLPDGFEVALDPAQVGDARLEVVDRLLGVGPDLGLVGFALGALEDTRAAAA